MGKAFSFLVVSFLAVGLLLGSCGGGGGGDSSVIMVSVDPAGSEGDDYSVGSAMSENGRYVAFRSAATNLVASDTNDSNDIFLRDIKEGITSRVSVSSAGTEADSNSYNPTISADGRFVGFASASSTLVPDDPDYLDVFVHDSQTGITSRVSVSQAGTGGNEGSGGAVLSSDGGYVAFRSLASNLIADDNNAVRDIFVRDMETGILARASVSTAGTEGDGDSWYPGISGDGRLVVFHSSSTNLDGNDPDHLDVFVHDTQTGITSRVSVSTAGTAGDGDSNDPAISADGRYVAFVSAATNLVPDDTNASYDIFVRDIPGGITSRVSVSTAGTGGDGSSYNPAISGDGRYVAFESVAANLVPDDTNAVSDIFVRDLQEGTTYRVSVSDAGAQADGDSDLPAISSDGRYVTFRSAATNLLDGTATSGEAQIYRVRWR